MLALRLLLQAGSLFLIARVLGPSLFGAFAGTAALAILLGTLTTFGTHLVLLAETSRHFKRRLRVLPYCVTTALFAGSCLLAMFISLTNMLFVDSPINTSLVLTIGIVEIIVLPLLSFPSVQLQACRRIVASQFVFLTPLAIRFLVILGIFLFPVSEPLHKFIIGSLLAGMIGLIVATIMLPNTWPAFHHWRIARRHEIRHAAGYAAINLAARGPTEIDKSLAGRLLPLATAGLYSGAARLVSAVNVPVVAMIQAALPTLFVQARDTEGIRPAMLATMTGVALLYGGCVAIVMWLLVPAISGLFGDAYTGIGAAAKLLCAAIPGATLRITSGAVLLARNQPWARVSFELSGIGVLILAAIFLVPHHGISGMIGAYILAEWTMAAIALLFVVRYRS